jgi:hypothetical protein
MSEEISALEESVKEVLTDLRTKKVMSKINMSAGVQESSTGGVQASPSTAYGEGTSRIMTEMRTNHRDNIMNAKLILSILPAYQPPLSDAINWDSVARYFEYALVMVYLPKGIRAV